MHILSSNQPYIASNIKPLPCLDWEDTPLLIHLLNNSLVSAGFWVESDLQCILCAARICPSIINPDHYPVLSTMSPGPWPDIWIALQTQHIQIKLLILLLKWDFLPKFLVKDIFFQACQLRTFETFKPYYDLLIKTYSLAISNHFVSQECYHFCTCF